MKKLSIYTVIVFILILLTSCASKSEYYISPPKDNDFNTESVSHLQEADINLIRNYIPEIVKWYNSIDISKPQSINFVTDEIQNMGNSLFTSDAFQIYLNNFISGISSSEEEKEKYEQIKSVNSIYGQVSIIMMTNNIEVSLSADQEMTINIEEDSWVELGNSIKNAIEYYYN
ncbi:MAG: hypothetical protein HDR24_09275 [Lachnospiraceae bacterium]|nr:hypothetical protein [Lachnospiraceae bacterium]